MGQSSGYTLIVAKLKATAALKASPVFVLVVVDPCAAVVPVDWWPGRLHRRTLKEPDATAITSSVGFPLPEYDLMEANTTEVATTLLLDTWNVWHVPAAVVAATVVIFPEYWFVVTVVVMEVLL